MKVMLNFAKVKDKLTKDFYKNIDRPLCLIRAVAKLEERYYQDFTQ